MKVKIFLILLFNLIFTFPLQAQDFCKVKEFVVSKSGEFKVKDISEDCNNLDWWRKVSNIYILQVNSERSVYLDKKEIIAIFKSRLGNISYKFIYPSRIILKKAYKVYTPDELFRLVKKELRHLYSGKEIVMRDFNFSQGIFLQKGERLKVNLVSNPKPGRNGLVFEVVDAFNKLKKRYSGSIFVDVWDSVPVLIRPLNRGDRLSPDCITYKLKNLAYINKDIWKGKDFSYRLKVSCGVGEVLTLDKLEPIPIISRGDKVNLVYKSKIIQLEGIGIALEDGFLGELVEVKNIDSKRKIVGKVISPGEVQVF